MTTRVCDKCQRPQTEALCEVREEFGNFELCSKCMSEGDELMFKIHDKWAEDLRQARIKAFHEWIGKPVIKKESWLKRQVTCLKTKLF